MNEDNFVFDLSEPSSDAAEQAVVNAEGQQPEGQGEMQSDEVSIEQQTQSMEELLARIAELESTPQSVVERIPEQALAILQDKNALKELAKDYEAMPMLDLLKEDFLEKNSKVLSANPDLDKEMAFRRYLQKNYNTEIEPAIDENFGLD